MAIVSVVDNDAMRAAERMAQAQGGVISRRQLLRCGVPRWRTRANIRARRWRKVFRQTVAIHRGPLPTLARQWTAVFEAGVRGALDGPSSLVAAGLKGFAVERERVSVPRGVKVFRTRAVNVRQTRRWRRDDIVSDPVPRVRTPVAAVHAAIWATTNRQAALLLTMTVQQRLASADELAAALLLVRRDYRRRFVESVIMELMDGAESLGEIDLAKGCRQRGIPEPDRQVVRQGAHGRYVLDARWSDYRLVVEVDGIHHLYAQQVVADAIRQNEVVLMGDAVLRLPLLGLRSAPEAFFEQIAEGLRRGGWHGSRAS